MPTIPGWVPPLASADRLQDRRITQTIAADSTAIPVAYGEVQIAGRVFAVDFDADTSTWTIGALFCAGEVESVSVLLNGETPPAGVTVNTYVGAASQTADSLLSAAISGYADDLVVEHPAGDIGICYAAIQYPNSVFTAFPQILGEIEGRLLYDPDADSTGYSATPALALRDLITSPHFGLGDSVDDTSVIAAAAANDELTGVGGEARRKVGLVLEQRRDTMEWVEILATYAGCWATKRGDTWVLVPDRPATTAATLTKSAGIFEPPSLADARQAPTVVRVVYTDKSESPWRDREAVAMLAGVSTGTVPRRESLVRLSGVDRYSQAAREAEERLAKFQRALLAGSATVFDDHLGLELGDIIEISSHPLYPTHTTFRITEPPSVSGPGRLQIRFSAYSTDDYDSSIPTASWGAGGAVIGSSDLLGTVDKTKITRDVSGQNLLGSAAGPRQEILAGAAEVDGFVHLYLSRVPIADLGARAGDLVSLSARVASYVSADDLRLSIAWRESDGTLIRTDAAEISTTTFRRFSVEASEVPYDDALISVGLVKDTDNQTSAIELAMLNLGPVALPFEQPPARIGRGEVDEGADVTADSPQPPSWLTALIDSGDIDAGSVEAVLDALSMINAPADAGATDGAPSGSLVNGIPAQYVAGARKAQALTSAGWWRMIEWTAGAGGRGSGAARIETIGGGSSTPGSAVVGWSIDWSGNIDLFLHERSSRLATRITGIRVVNDSPNDRGYLDIEVSDEVIDVFVVAVGSESAQLITTSAGDGSKDPSTGTSSAVLDLTSPRPIWAHSTESHTNKSFVDDDGDRWTQGVLTERGADVTFANPQAPSWLTALIASGDIDAASVEAVLDVLNAINGPAEAASTKGVIDAQGSATSGTQTVDRFAWTTIEETTITTAAGEEVFVVAGFLHELISAGNGAGDVRVLRGAAEIIGPVSVFIRQGTYQSWSMPAFETPGAGSHTYKLQHRGGNDYLGTTVKDAVVVAQKVR